MEAHAGWETSSEALSVEIVIGLGVRLVNRGVILVEPILEMDLIILPLMVINSLFAEGDSYVEELEAPDDAGGDASEGRRSPKA